MTKNKNEIKKGLPFSIKVSLTGLFGGFFGGLLGIGGSFLVIPFLTGPLGISQHKAHASALPVAVVAGLSSLGFYFSTGHINLNLSYKVIIGSLSGVLIGARLMRYIRGNWLSFLFGFFLFIMAAGFAMDMHSRAIQEATNQNWLFSILIGFLAGIASGLFGAGGGTILVPGAVLLLHVGQQSAQGISLLTIIPTSLLGTWAHYKAGNLSLLIIPYLMATAFVGGIFGGFVAVMTHVSILKTLLIIVLVFIGSRNIWKYWPKKKRTFSSVLEEFKVE